MPYKIPPRNTPGGAFLCYTQNMNKRAVTNTIRDNSAYQIRIIQDGNYTGGRVGMYYRRRTVFGNVLTGRIYQL